MRLDRVLAQSGLGSRSEVQHLIRRGDITIDGEIVCDPGYHVAEIQQKLICRSGQPIHFRAQIHLMLNKPAGLITALDDARQQTVMSLIPPIWINRGIAPVGRLDRDTTGLLLLTTDGTLNHRLTSPRWSIWKTYQVVYTGERLQMETIAQFKAGIQRSSSEQFKPAVLTILGDQTAEISIQEGKFHQVKKMFQAVNRTVIKLHRTKIGPLMLDPDLTAGQYRELTESEISALYEKVHLQYQ